ncbi:MAG: YiiX/YebB-like N1pC/P60 family cysteine hydrolase [Candidatus Contendobacter sp.]|nr:YiiX/YebB-like N1pC/P60 family cysteine hydrolase [Candidatus Contendobacter sp.]MDG4556483.1 YiiX/YebB-like N1pC/P60 family cysteine hydrolase [Candidatus Contendobacter sp.]
MTKPKLYNESMRAKLKTGDVVLFSGKGGVSAGIKWATLSRWSHVGMIVFLPEYDFVTVWESTTLSSIVDLDTKVPRKGVQLVPLSSRIEGYDGEIAVRQLDGVTFDSDDIKRLMQLRRELAGREYEQDKIELIRAAYDGPLGRNSEDLTSLFCSELVAEAYQRLGLLSEEKPSNEYTPADFSEKKVLKLLKGSLGKEIFLKAET